MEIDRINRSMPILPTDTVNTFRKDEERSRLIAAVRALNKSEFFGNDRELMFSRDPETQKPVIQILEPEHRRKAGTDSCRDLAADHGQHVTRPGK